MSNAPMRPNFVALPLTAQCNYRCGFCEIVGVDEKLKGAGLKYQRNNMTVEHVEAFIPFIRSAGTINLGGRTAIGEPMFAPRFDDIVRKIRSINRNIVIDLSTNGLLLTRDRANFLIENAPVAVTFSMHAASADTYNAVMGPGKADRFDRVVENIRYFCGIRRGRPTRVNINFGIGRLNHQDAVRAVGLAKDLGVDMMTVYLYYKSPNSFVEDVSLYDDVSLANGTLRAVYDEAARVGLNLDPQQPNFMKDEVPQGFISAQDLASGRIRFPPSIPEAPRYTGGCIEPFSSFLLKSDPTRAGKAAIAVCNRISPMIVDIERVMTEDLFWAWHHPIFNSLRLPNPLAVPPICGACKDPSTGALRSLNHEEYKKRRDCAVKETLAPYQTEQLRSSPTGAVRLVSENIFSIDAPVEEYCSGGELVKIGTEHGNREA
mgnify:CR=1 FL=1